MKRRNLLKGFIGTVMGVTAAPLLAKVSTVPETEVTLPPAPLKFTPDLKASDNGYRPIIISVVGPNQIQRDNVTAAIKSQYSSEHTVIVYESFRDFEALCLKHWWPDHEPLDPFASNMFQMMHANKNVDALHELTEFRSHRKLVLIVADNPRENIMPSGSGMVKDFTKMRNAPTAFFYVVDGNIVINDGTIIAYRSNSKTAPVFEALNWA